VVYIKGLERRVGKDEKFLANKSSHNYEKFIGIIIEESLESKELLKKLKIIKTSIEKVTKNHKTPWIKQWTLHTVEISENQADKIAKELSTLLDSKHSWYADFKNSKFHYIIFRNKIFKVDRSKQEQYSIATEYGLTLGIPNYQLDFSPHIKEWEREFNV